MSLLEYDRVLLELASLKNYFFDKLASPIETFHSPQASVPPLVNQNPHENFPGSGSGREQAITIESDEENGGLGMKIEEYSNVTIPLKASSLSTTPRKGGSSTKKKVIRKKVIKPVAIQTRNSPTIDKKLFPAKAIGKKALKATKHTHKNEETIKTRLRGSLKKNN